MKKFKKYTKVFLALAILLSSTMACNDWLSIAPENDLIKEKFWLKTDDAEAALAATYNAFRDAVLESFIWGELRADLAIFADNHFADYNNIAASNITANNHVIKWEKYYNAINLANTLMFFSDEVAANDKTFTPKMQRAFEAEALFIRSLSYFYLVRVWKEVPLVLEASTSDQGDLFLPKSTEKEILHQIIEDLKRAKDLAYTNEFRNKPEYYKGRANKYSIMALLADVYLWNEQYQECASYCDSIIATGLFELESYNDWFRLYNPGNSMKESIFEIQFNDNYESQNNPFYNNLIPNIGSARISLNSITATSLFNRNDLRLIGNKSPSWKYQGIDYSTNTRRSGNQRDANVIYYRYADVLLMKAEALTELGMLTEANANLRQVVERAGLTHIEMVNKNELRKAVLDENAREFVFEGKRWFDLLRSAKRNNFENRQIIINMILSGADIKQQAVLRTRVYDTMSYYLPVPENDLLYNNNLVQNPFYDR
jgi:hypothetical protein